METKSPYKIKFIYTDTLTPIQKDISAENFNSLILKGDILNIEKLEREIGRMTYVANDKGYYSFTKIISSIVLTPSIRIMK